MSEHDPYRGAPLPPALRHRPNSYEPNSREVALLFTNLVGLISLNGIIWGLWKRLMGSVDTIWLIAILLSFFFGWVFSISKSRRNSAQVSQKITIGESLILWIGVGTIVGSQGIHGERLSDLMLRWMEQGPGGIWLFVGVFFTSIAALFRMSRVWEEGRLFRENFGGKGVFPSLDVRDALPSVHPSISLSNSRDSIQEKHLDPSVNMSNSNNQKFRVQDISTKVSADSSGAEVPLTDAELEALLEEPREVGHASLRSAPHEEP